MFPRSSLTPPAMLVLWTRRLIVSFPDHLRPYLVATSTRSPLIDELLKVFSSREPEPLPQHSVSDECVCFTIPSLPFTDDFRSENPAEYARDGLEDPDDSDDSNVTPMRA